MKFLTYEHFYEVYKIIKCTKMLNNYKNIREQLFVVKISMKFFFKNIIGLDGHVTQAKALKCYKNPLKYNEVFTNN